MFLNYHGIIEQKFLWIFKNLGINYNNHIMDYKLQKKELFNLLQKQKEIQIKKELLFCYQVHLGVEKLQLQNQLHND